MKKILFALLLMLNHSLMFGAVQAASLPDEDHPFGKAIPHDHLHHHDHHDHHEMNEHAPSHDESHHQTNSAASDDEHHDHHHHSHGMHAQLNCDLPCSRDLNLQKRCCEALTYYHVTHQSLTYSPPVPPPNH